MKNNDDGDTIDPNEEARQAILTALNDWLADHPTETRSATLAGLIDAARSMQRTAAPSRDPNAVLSPSQGFGAIADLFASEFNKMKGQN